MKTKISKSCITIATVLALGGVLGSWDAYHPSPLARIAQEMPAFSGSGKTKDLKVSTKAYTSEESKKFLGSDLPKINIQPVQITVQNDTSYAYYLSVENITLPSTEPKKVINKISKGSVGRSIGLKIASFLFWPFMIPSTIDGMITYKSQKNLKRDYLAKSLKKEIVQPYSTVHRVLFVPKDKYQATYTLTLVNQQTEKEVFFKRTG